MSNITQPTATMSSLELVEIINSLRGEDRAELRHDNFMKKIESHPGIDSPKFLGQYKDSTGRTLKCYNLPKRECELMVMSESLEVQTKVYDRMTALEAAVVGNVSTAKPEKPAALPKPTREFKDYYSVAKLIGLDKNAAAIAANQAVMKLTGTNVLDLLGSTSMEAERQDQWFTPTELGQRIGFSGRGFNQMLAQAGLQTKHEDVWEVSEVGKQFARMFDTGKKHGNGTPVTQVKWSPSVIEVLERNKQAA